jgi:hypothetical protein
MKTQVEFRSSKFPPCEGEGEQINPGLWGKRLAEYLAQKLSERGIKTEQILASDPEMTTNAVSAQWTAVFTNIAPTGGLPVPDAASPAFFRLFGKPNNSF